MSNSIIQGALHVNGALSASSFTPPTGSVTKESIAASAGIETSKMVHKHRISFPMDSRAAGGTAAGTYRIHTVLGATGTLQKFKAGFATKPASGNYQVDLHKNGASILSAVLTLDSSITNDVPEVAVISSMAVAVDDRIEIVLADNSAASEAGFFAILEIDEAAA